MNEDKLFRFYVEELFSKEEAYRFIGNLQAADNLTAQEIMDALYARELLGDLSVAPGVIMPHYVSQNLDQSSVSLISLKPPIAFWDETMSEVKLLIVLALKQDEIYETRQEITKFIRKMVDMAFVDCLLKLNSETELMNLLKKENKKR
ncbi:PTS sugar transporter subunit IIA [Lactovum odontotermitis]